MFHSQKRLIFSQEYVHFLSQSWAHGIVFTWNLCQLLFEYSFQMSPKIFVWTAEMFCKLTFDLDCSFERCKRTFCLIVMRILCTINYRSPMFEHSVKKPFAHGLYHLLVFHAWIESSIKLYIIGFLLKMLRSCVVEILLRSFFAYILKP